MVDCCHDLLVDEEASSPSTQPSSSRPLQQPATRKRGRTNVCEYIDADGQLQGSGNTYRGLLFSVYVGCGQLTGIQERSKMVIWYIPPKECGFL